MKKRPRRVLKTSLHEVPAKRGAQSKSSAGEILVGRGRSSGRKNNKGHERWSIGVVGRGGRGGVRSWLQNPPLLGTQI